MSRNTKEPNRKQQQGESIAKRLWRDHETFGICSCPNTECTHFAMVVAPFRSVNPGLPNYFFIVDARVVARITNERVGSVEFTEKSNQALDVAHARIRFAMDRIGTDIDQDAEFDDVWLDQSGAFCFNYRVIVVADQPNKQKVGIAMLLLDEAGKSIFASPEENDRGR